VNQRGIIEKNNLEEFFTRIIKGRPPAKQLKAQEILISARENKKGWGY